jgi:DNA-binding SARP family transcriptional activator
MLTRAVAVLIAASAITASAAGLAHAAPAGKPVSGAPPAGCGPAGYPAAFGIWCPGRVHLVVRGNSLWELAQTYLGNGHLWPEIDILGRGRPQPCRPAPIFPGQILLIPATGLPSGPGQATQPGSCLPASHQPTPSPSTRPSPGPATTRTPQPTARPSARQHISRAPVRLPLEVLAGLAIAILIGAAALFARRRARPRTVPVPQPEPGWPPTTSASPGPVSPWPGSSAFDHDGIPDDPYDLELHEGSETGTANPAPAVSSVPLAVPAAWPGQLAAPARPAARTGASPAGHIPLATRDGQEITADISALGGLGLTGPGASAAARAVLATLLSEARSSPEDPAIPVIVPADAAALLLAPTAEADRVPGIIPGLSRPASLTAALDEIEALILRRARLAPLPDDEHWPPRAAAAAGPTVALVAIPGQADTRRLHSIIASGQDFGVMVIILGEWPYGVTCHVAADGTVTAASPPDSGLAGARLYCLSLHDFNAATGLDNVPPSTPPDQGPAIPASQSPDRQESRFVTPAANPPDPHRAPAITELAPEGSRPVQINMLGPLQITAIGHEIGTGPRKARELLAFLAVHGAGGATGDAISEALWPAAPPDYGTRQRNIALRKARDLLRNSTGRSAPMWIILTADRYRLDPALIESDLWQFTTALDAARAADNDQDRLVAYQEAASCYRGPLCDGADYDWAEPYAETARHRALDVWTRIAGILQDTDSEQALAALETALTHDPYNEYIYQQIMRLHAAEGRTDAVRRTFELLQARLTELGITTPRTSTRQAVAALLGDSGPFSHPAGQSSPATASAGRPAPARPRDPARGVQRGAQVPRSRPRRTM